MTKTNLGHLPKNFGTDSKISQRLISDGVAALTNYLSADSDYLHGLGAALQGELHVCAVNKQCPYTCTKTRTETVFIMDTLDSRLGIVLFPSQGRGTVSML